MRILLGAVLIVFSIGQAAAQGKTSAGEAHVLSAFATGADPGVLAENVRAGPTLRAQLGVETDSRGIYEWVASHTAGVRPRVTLLSPAEAVGHAALGVNVTDQLMRVEAGAAAFLVQYSPAQKSITFVEQLSAVTANAPLLTPAPPLAALAPPPAPPAPRTAPVQKRGPRTGPRGECVVKPVMSEDDLWNCVDAPASAAAPVPAPVPEVKPEPPAPAVATVPPTVTECVIKPVMSEEELRVCASAKASSTPIIEAPAAPVAAVALVPQRAAAKPSGECVIKPVMSDEDLRNCANVKGSVAPAPPAIDTSFGAAALSTRAPAASRECVIKPVMSDEDLRNCAAARGSTAPTPNVVEAPVAAAAAAPAPARAPAAPPECVIKPVMSDQDLRNCANVKASSSPIPTAVETSVPAAAPQARAPAAPRECVIKPVMSDDDLRACRR
jgi:hypothetical protein